MPLPLVFTYGFLPRAVVSGFFVFYNNSNTMRSVGGSVLKTPLHEQAKAGSVGEYLERGG
jgi:hypothetical protein